VCYYIAIINTRSLNSLLNDPLSICQHCYVVVLVHWHRKFISARLVSITQCIVHCVIDRHILTEIAYIINDYTAKLLDDSYNVC